MLICQCLQSLSFTLLLQHFYSFFSSFRLKALLATQLSTSHVINFGYSGESVYLDFAWLSLKCTEASLAVFLFRTTVYSHFTHFWLNFQTNRFSPLLFSCIASIASSILSPLLTLVFPPGSLRGVRRKRSSRTPFKISYFSRLCCHISIPDSRGSFILRLHPLPSTEGKGPGSSLALKGRIPPWLLPWSRGEDSQ